MNSGKKRRARLKQERLEKRENAKRVRVSGQLSKYELSQKLKVDRDALAPNRSYGVPKFVERGYYEDMPFICKDCGVIQVWRSTQQKWWYEVMKGDIWTISVRCRPCRKQERDRKTAARQIHLAGLNAKDDAKEVGQNRTDGETTTR